MNRGTAATFPVETINSQRGWHAIKGAKSQGFDEQTRERTSSPFRHMRSRRRSFLSDNRSQPRNSSTDLSIYLRGGSTMQRKKTNHLADTTEDAIFKERDDLKKTKSTASQPEQSVSTPASTSVSASSPDRTLAILQLSSFLTLLSANLVAFSPAPALIAKIGSERATSTLSTVAACAALTEIVVFPAYGSLLDSIGRKPALLFTISCIAFVHGLVSIHSSVLTICGAKFIATMSFASFVTTTQVIINDITESNPERMSSILGITYALFGCSFCVGAIGAGKLSDFGLSVTYGTSALVAALSAGLVLSGMQETLPSSKRIPFEDNKSVVKKRLLQSPLSSCTRILFRHSKEVRIMAILIMMQSLPFQMNETFQILVKTEWKIDIKDFSSFVAMVGFINIFGNMVGSQVVRRLGIKYFTAFATLSSVLAPIGATIFSFRGLVIGTIIGFLASAQMMGVTAALYGEGAKSNIPQGELAGERSSFLALAKVFGPIWYSFLYVTGKKIFGIGFLPFLFNAGCGLMAFVISQRYLPS